MRLNRFLAEGGLCSRRKADELIRSGQVKLNGEAVQELGVQVDPETDLVQVSGRAIHPPSRRVVLLLNKPKGVLCTVTDTHGRRTVMDLVELDLRVVPVGRLDADSTGALLLTNDGELMNSLLHPSSHVPKEYIVLTDRELTPEEIVKLAGGIRMDGSRTKPCEIERIGRTGSRPRYRMVLTEGRNRQIRRMLDSIGAHVERLHRRSLAGLSVEDLEPGQWRVLLGKEVDRLRKAVRLAAEANAGDAPRPAAKPAPTRTRKPGAGPRRA
ncbi:MAG: pseudouridine synthase [Candidatus Delongbacteria bacterium]